MTTVAAAPERDLTVLRSFARRIDPSDVLQDAYVEFARGLARSRGSTRTRLYGPGTRSRATKSPVESMRVS